MENRKLRPTSFDYALAALSPVLIILMIGSLVYFLITTLYQGDFHARLMWILGLFTMASVLITRIAIEQSRAQSLTYLGLLSAATLFVAPRFFVLEGILAPLSIPILIGFLALIVFLADRITMDCTSVDDAQDSHGYGLLQSLGLLKRSDSVSANPESADNKGRNHNPGVWILYFALLALPIFGLGQFFLPSGQAQRIALGCLVIYLSAALALLVMISLLSLRQYVRQRDVEMQTGMSWSWLASGIGSVLGLVVLMAILPLPMLGTSNWELPFKLSSRDDMTSSKWGWGNEGVKQQQPQGQQPQGQQPQGQQPQGQQPQGQQPQGQQPQGQQPQGQQPQGQQPQGQQPQGQQPQGQQPQGQQPQGQQPQGQQPQGQQPQGQQPQGQQPQGQQPQGQQPQGQQPQGQQPQGQQRQGQQLQGQQSQGQQSQGQQPQGQQPQGQQPQGQQPQGQQPQGQQPATPPPQQNWKPPTIDWNLGATLRWLIIATLALIALVYGVKYFRQWLSWFGQGQQEESVSASSTVTDSTPSLRFCEIENPFRAHRNDPDAIVRSLFQAVSIWGKEHRVARTEDETPDEYSRRLGRKYSEIAESLTSLGLMVSRMAYAKKSIPRQDAMSLESLWEWLKAHDSLPSQR
ncbi:MAG: DUF4129 domain-containing protein [Planctomycetaceae bacterium]|nr:DUF4129 domain-containing protein [Planctomycetaceae bacterium]